MTTAQVWAGLSEAEQHVLYALCMPTMRAMPRLLTLRYQARQADLANREIPGANARRIEWARWLRVTHRLSDE